MKNNFFQNLKISNKLIIAFICISLIPLLIFIAVSMDYISSSFSDAKKIRIEDGLIAAQNITNNENDYLIKSVRDYAHWDDLYNIAITKDPAWLKNYVTDWVPENNDIDWILGVDKEGNIFYKYNNPNEYNTNLSNLEFFTKTMSEEEIKGYMLTTRGLYIVASSPILKTDGSGPARGMWLYGQSINENYTKKISDIGNFNISYYHLDGNLLASSITDDSNFNKLNIKAEYPNLFEQVATNLNNVVENRANITSIYSPIYDFNNNCVGVIAISKSSSDFSAIAKHYGRIALLMSILVLIMIIFASINFVKIIRNPIKDLTDSMNINNKDIPKKVEVKSQDEIGVLADSFNKMIDRIKDFREELNRSNKKMEENNKKLESKIHELEKFKRLTVDRELKMIELKKEIKKNKTEKFKK